MVTPANGFATRGHRVDLVLAQRYGPYLADVSHEVRVHDLGASRVFASIVPLAAYLRRERPFAQLSAMNHANAAAVIAGRLARAATRIVVSERIAISIEAARARSLVERFLYAALPSLYSLADAIIAVSRPYQEMAQAISSAGAGCRQHRSGQSPIPLRPARLRRRRQKRLIIPGSQSLSRQWCSGSAASSSRRTSQR